MDRLVCRIPLAQTEGSALLVGQMVVTGLNGTEFRKATRALMLSDATREAVVLWLNQVNNARMRSIDLKSVDNIPIRLNNSLKFGDVWIEEA
jgi:hypothetical protein